MTDGGLRNCGPNRLEWLTKSLGPFKRVTRITTVGEPFVKIRYSMPLLALAALFSTAANATDPAALLQTHCQRCHDNTIYTRAEPLVLTYSALKQRVAFCDRAAGANMSDSQMQSVIDYLNQHYYHFEKK